MSLDFTAVISSVSLAGMRMTGRTEDTVQSPSQCWFKREFTDNITVERLHPHSYYVHHCITTPVLTPTVLEVR